MMGFLKNLFLFIAALQFGHFAHAECTDLILGDSPKSLELRREIQKLSQNRVAILITGERGTGKTSIARDIHNKSDRKTKPFVAVNCGSIPDNLAESEFFGHTRGSFTGAYKDQTGFFLQANQGTLFLDEIGELKPAAQTALLHVLDTKLITPIGASHPIPVDVRIIAATNKNLEAEVKRGTFRADLLDRLNVIRVHAPALRERRDDIPKLVNHFLSLYRAEGPQYNVPYQLAPGVIEVLTAYPWHGNVRELSNHILGAIAMSDSPTLTVADFRLDAHKDPTPVVIPIADPANRGAQLVPELLEQSKTIIADIDRYSDFDDALTELTWRYVYYQYRRTNFNMSLLVDRRLRRDRRNTIRLAEQMRQKYGPDLDLHQDAEPHFKVDDTIAEKLFNQLGPSIVSMEHLEIIERQLKWTFYNIKLEEYGYNKEDTAKGLGLRGDSFRRSFSDLQQQFETGSAE